MRRCAGQQAKDHPSSSLWQKHPSAVEDVRWALDAALQGIPELAMAILLSTATAPVRNPEEAELLRGSRLLIDRLVAAGEQPLDSNGLRPDTGAASIPEDTGQYSGAAADRLTGALPAGKAGSVQELSCSMSLLQITERHSGLLEWLREHIVLTLSGARCAPRCSARFSDRCFGRSLYRCPDVS